MTHNSARISSPALNTHVGTIGDICPNVCADGGVTMKCVLVIAFMSVANAKTPERVRFPPFRLTPRTTINRRYYFITKTTVRIKRQNQACVMIYMLRDTSLTHCGAHFHWEGGITGCKMPAVRREDGCGTAVIQRHRYRCGKNNFRLRMRARIAAKYTIFNR